MMWKRWKSEEKHYADETCIVIGLPPNRNPTSRLARDSRFRYSTVRPDQTSTCQPTTEENRREASPDLDPDLPGEASVYRSVRACRCLPSAGCVPESKEVRARIPESSVAPQAIAAASTPADLATARHVSAEPFGCCC